MADGDEEDVLKIGQCAGQSEYGAVYRGCVGDASVLVVSLDSMLKSSCRVDPLSEEGRRFSDHLSDSFGTACDSGLDAEFVLFPVGVQWPGDGGNDEDATPSVLTEGTFHNECLFSQFQSQEAGTASGSRNQSSATRQQQRQHQNGHSSCNGDSVGDVHSHPHSQVRTPYPTLDVCDLIDIACDLATAVVDIHRHDQVHGNIRSSLLTLRRADKHIKARLLYCCVADAVRSTLQEFEPEYLLKAPTSAPERVNGPLRQLQPSEDVYCFGATMLELCLGRPLGSVASDVRKLSDLHPLYEVVLMCTSSQPQLRPSMATVLERCVEQRQTSSYIHAWSRTAGEYVQKMEDDVHLLEIERESHAAQLKRCNRRIEELTEQEEELNQRLKLLQDEFSQVTAEHKQVISLVEGLQANKTTTTTTNSSSSSCNGESHTADMYDHDIILTSADIMASAEIVASADIMTSSDIITTADILATSDIVTTADITISAEIATTIEPCSIEAQDEFTSAWPMNSGDTSSGVSECMVSDCSSTPSDDFNSPPPVMSAPEISPPLTIRTHTPIRPVISLPVTSRYTCNGIAADSKDTTAPAAAAQSPQWMQDSMQLEGNTKYNSLKRRKRSCGSTESSRSSMSQSPTSSVSSTTVFITEATPPTAKKMLQATDTQATETRQSEQHREQDPEQPVQASAADIAAGAAVDTPVDTASSLATGVAAAAATTPADQAGGRNTSLRRSVSQKLPKTATERYSARRNSVSPTPSPILVTRRGSIDGQSPPTGRVQKMAELFRSRAQSITPQISHSTNQLASANGGACSLSTAGLAKMDGLRHRSRSYSVLLHQPAMQHTTDLSASDGSRKIPVGRARSIGEVTSQDPRYAEWTTAGPNGNAPPAPGTKKRIASVSERVGAARQKGIADDTWWMIRKQ
ncbi:uncharacterized protein LOC135816209 [Sycon ciliatum]|uniref:uncharacterized protein LOC135816209 n=1 Tax=Sycon ciliatum TaxID=27933 RepID=UPI0031F6608C